MINWLTYRDEDEHLKNLKVFIKNGKTIAVKKILKDIALRYQKPNIQYTKICDKICSMMITYKNQRQKYENFD